MDTNGSVVMARGRRVAEARWKWARGREIGASVIVSTLKIKLKKYLGDIFAWPNE